MQKLLKAGRMVVPPAPNAMISVMLMMVMIIWVVEFSREGTLAKTELLYPKNAGS